MNGQLKKRAWNLAVKHERLLFGLYWVLVKDDTTPFATFAVDDKGQAIPRRDLLPITQAMRREMLDKWYRQELEIIWSEKKTALRG